MSKVLLDTNFVLNAIRNKLDLFEELFQKGHQILIPKEVILEIERLRDGTKALKFREEAIFALKLIAVSDYMGVSCPGRYVDKGIKKYCDENPQVILGTMDKELKKSVKNRKMVIRNLKKLELQ